MISLAVRNKKAPIWVLFFALNNSNWNHLKIKKPLLRFLNIRGEDVLERVES